MKEYLKWFFTEHIKNGRGKLKVIATLYGIFQVIYFPQFVLEEYYGGWIPLFPVVLFFLIIWGFLIGIIYQPINIYLKVKRLAARLEAEKLIEKERKAKVSKAPKKKNVKKKTTRKRAVKDDSKNIKKNTKGLK